MEKKTSLIENKYAKLTLIAGTIIVLDQITKALILKYLPLYNIITVIPGFFNITHIQNPGGAFGFMANQGPGLRSILFLFVSAIAIGVIFFFYKTTPSKDKWLTTGLSLIFGGAIGNLIDRIRFGKVVDFLDFYIREDLHWPSFNIADSAITIGITIFIIQMLFKDKHRQLS
ncbi:MAG: signal peptidase II [Desulfobacterales bacterium]|nr:signal peptidase II [Desulfobacterales bacterium]